MRIPCAGPALALAFLFACASPALAAPLPSSRSKGVTAETATIVFDPPLDTPIRYRSEKIEAKGTITRSNWDISRYDFAKTGDGYRMTVTVEDSGSNETDPMMLRIERKLAELIQQPYVVTLTEGGAITGIENLSVYWTKIFDAFDEELRSPDNSLPAEARTAFASFLGGFRSMPETTRLALMTEGLAPIVEFADTETTVGKPVHATVETDSPLGTKFQRDVYVNLDRIDGDDAVIRMHATIPPDEAKALSLAYVEKMVATLKPGTVIPKDAFAKLTIVHETQAEYQVSLIDGLLDSYSSTETIGVTTGEDTDARQGRITSRKIARID